MKTIILLLGIAIATIAMMAITTTHASTTANAADINLIPLVPPATTNYDTFAAGSCMCDLSPGLCDANCCCDPDCAGQTGAFTGCDRANGGDNQKLMCAPETDGTTVLRSTQEVFRKEHFGESSICVVKTNLVDREGLSMFYELPSATAQAALAAPASPWPAPAATAATTTAFVQGDLIPVLNAVPTGGAPAYTRSVLPYHKYLKDSVPGSSGGGGACDADAKIRFLHDHESQSCFQSGALATLCAAGGPLNVDVYRYLAIMRPDGLLSGVNLVKPVTIRFVNDATGALLEDIALAEGTNIFTIAFGGVAADPGATVVTAFDGTNCNNGVSALRWSIEYDEIAGSAYITRAQLVVRVLASRPPVASNTYAVSTAVRFVKKGSAAAALVDFVSATLAGNDAAIASERKRSGNPGYTRGVPIRAGVRALYASGEDGVFEMPRGFELPMGGDCASTGTFAQVPFLHDVAAASCTVSMTEAVFKGKCASLLTDIAGFVAPVTCGGAACPANASKFIDRIGRDGIASYTDSNDWVAVQGATTLATPASAIYDDFHHKCDNTVVGLKWTFGVARAGAVYNPQDVVVTAKVEAITGSLRWANSAVGVATAPIRFRFEAHFVRLPEGGAYIRKEIVPPSLFPAVDEDVFYPFSRPGN